MLHLMLPVFISIAVIVPFPTPFAIESKTGTAFPSVPLTKKLNPILLDATYTVSLSQRILLYHTEYRAIFPRYHLCSE